MDHKSSNNFAKPCMNKNNEAIAELNLTLNFQMYNMYLRHTCIDFNLIL